MFAAAIAYLESKTPTWIKVLIALAVVGWMLPIEVRDRFYNTIDTRVYAVIAPLKVNRDNEIQTINTHLKNLDKATNETNQFVKAMALEQLGAKRYQEVNLTAVDNNK